MTVSHMFHRVPRGPLAVVATAALVLACGGQPAATAPGDAPPTPPGEPTSLPSGAPSGDGPAPDFTPGSVAYRVVNLGAQPVDVYVRSQGLVQAWPVQMGLEPGAVMDYVSPPDPGALLVTAAGAGDPTCVGSCDHFLARLGNTNASGDRMTVVIHPEGVTELWERPQAEDVGRYANALRPADPATGLLLVIGQAVEGADFGLRLAIGGQDGCVSDVDETNVLIGGTSVNAYAMDGAAQVTLHDSGDSDCSDTPLGGPFEVEAQPGERTLLLLHGSTSAMEALALPVGE